MRAPLYKQFDTVIVQSNDGAMSEAHITKVVPVFAHCDRAGNPREPYEELPEWFFQQLEHPVTRKGDMIIVDVAECRFPVGDQIALYITPRYFIHSGYCYDCFCPGLGTGTFAESMLFLPINKYQQHEQEKGNTNHPTLLLPQA